MHTNRIYPTSYKFNKQSQDDVYYNNIIIFIIGLFSYLKNKKMCFLSGTIIFEDDNNKLFNLLTYGIRNMTDDICSKEHTNLATPHITKTHAGVFKKEGVSAIDEVHDCFKLNKAQNHLKNALRCEKTCFKMELKLKKNINYLCDYYELNPNPKNISKKSVVLFYNFIYKEKKYLFFKLEEYSMNNLSHIATFLNQKRIDEYVKRRENENNPDYITDLYSKDNDFYQEILSQEKNEDIKKNILNKIRMYNEKLRTGRELFIFEELKELLLGDEFYNIYNGITRYI